MSLYLVIRTSRTPLIFAKMRDRRSLLRIPSYYIHVTDVVIVGPTSKTRLSATALRPKTRGPPRPKTSASLANSRNSTPNSTGLST
jgi:hypothetical protein